MEALSCVSGKSLPSAETLMGQKMESIFEFAVSSGVANKKFTPAQLIAIAEVAGDKGTIEYTPDHYMVMRIPTTEPDAITKSAGTA